MARRFWRLKYNKYAAKGKMATASPRSLPGPNTLIMEFKYT
jgi:hypothetical protein